MELRTFITPPEWELNTTGATAVLNDHCHVAIRRTVFDGDDPKIARKTHRATLTIKAGVWDFDPYPVDFLTKKPIPLPQGAIDVLMQSISADRALYAKMPEGPGVVVAPPSWCVSDATGKLIPRCRVDMETFIDAAGAREWLGQQTGYAVMDAEGAFDFETPVTDIAGKPLQPEVAQLSAAINAHVGRYGCQSHLLPLEVGDKGTLIVRAVSYDFDRTCFKRCVTEIETPFDKPDVSKLAPIVGTATVEALKRTVAQAAAGGVA